MVREVRRREECEAVWDMFGVIWPLTGVYGLDADGRVLLVWRGVWGIVGEKGDLDDDGREERLG